MKNNLTSENKNNTELLSELQDLQKKYNSLKKSYEANISQAEQQNIKLSQLNHFSVELSNMSSYQKMEVTISKMIKEVTGARFTVFSEYDADDKTLTVQHVELEAGLLEKAIQLLGRQVKKFKAPVDDETYQVMTTELIGVRNSLYEATFGSVSQTTGKAIQALLNVNRFIGIAYIIEGKLYGTSLVALSKNQPDPPRQILENIRFLGAVSLRRRRAENALHESQDKIAALLEALPDSMFLQNKDGIYLDYHVPKEFRLYATPDMFIGKSMFEILPPHIASNFKEIFERAINTKEVQSFEYNLNILGEEYYFESKTIAYEDDKVLSIIREITERKKAELKITVQNEELTKLNEDKNRFISILAHDLKSPFNSILGLLDLLAENVHRYETTKTEKLIKVVRNSSRHFYQLLESLLLWARSQSGKMTFEPQDLHLNGISSSIVEELQLNADSKNISINLALKNDIYILADLDMLKTILRNLLSNAIKFTNPGGQIDIMAEQDKSFATVVISDNGIGMSQQTIDNLFLFSGYHKTEGTQGESGSGLGLFLCRELVEKNNGRIWVESEEGKGSKFKFTLPISK